MAAVATGRRLPRCHASLREKRADRTPGTARRETLLRSSPRNPRVVNVFFFFFLFVVVETTTRRVVVGKRCGSYQTILGRERRRARCARAVDRTYERSPAGGRTRTERSSTTLADPLSRSHVPSFRLPPPPPLPHPRPPARRAPCVVRRHSATVAPSLILSPSLPLSFTFLATARPSLRHIAAERARIRRRGHARGRKTR